MALLKIIPTESCCFCARSPERESACIIHDLGKLGLLVLYIKVIHLWLVCTLLHSVGSYAVHGVTEEFSEFSGRHWIKNSRHNFRVYNSMYMLVPFYQCIYAD